MNEQKEKEREKAILAQYGLFTEDPRDVKSCKTIFDTLYKQIFPENKILSLNSADMNRVTVAYLKTLAEQNWMIIRYLDKINRKLDKLDRREDRDDVD